MPDPARPIIGQVLRYGATGAANTALGLAVILFLHASLGINLIASNAAGYAVGFAFSYYVNRRWTFRHTGPTRRSLALFCLLVPSAFMINLGVVIALTELGVTYFLAQTAGVCTYTVLVFLGTKYVVFPPNE